MDDHVYVYATVTDPFGEIHAPQYIGCLPAWAAADPAAFRPWKAARRAGVLDSLSMSDRPGFRFRYTVREDML